MVNTTDRVGGAGGLGALCMCVRGREVPVRTEEVCVCVCGGGGVPVRTEEVCVCVWGGGGGR